MLSLALAVAVLGQAEPADIRMRVSGSGGWEVSCVFQTTDGERTRSARGRGLSHFDDLRAIDATAATCTVEVPERGQLLVRVAEAEGFACPFDPAADMDDCQATFVGPAAERFVLER